MLISVKCTDYSDCTHQTENNKEHNNYIMYHHVVEILCRPFFVPLREANLKIRLIDLLIVCDQFIFQI